MDDIWIGANDKQSLWEIASDVSQFVQYTLSLQLKEKVTQVLPITEGIPWLGMRIFRNAVRLQNEGRKRFITKLRANKRYLEEESVKIDLRASAASLCGHLKHASCMLLRRSLIDSFF